MVMAVFVAELACTDFAVASCGDYLHTRYSKPHFLQSSAFSDAIYLSVVDLQPVSAEPQSPGGPTVPVCHGPQCRQSPAPIQVPESPVRTISDDDRSAFLSALVRTSADDRADARLRESRVHADRGFPLTVMIPPECV